METRLIVEQFDPERPIPGGVDTCIRGLVQYCPPDIDLRVAGVDAIGNKTVGVWAEHQIGGRKFQFMPLAHIDYANLHRAIPHSVWIAKALLKFRPAPEADVIQTHRINTGAVAIQLYPNARHVQFIHVENELKNGSRSFFRYATFSYHWLEKYVIPRTVDTVVFNTVGAQRLRGIAEHVRFSPTWYDGSQFFPPATEVVAKTRIIWACRIEPGKNPQLAVDVMAALPERYTLTIAGSGTMETFMREYARKSTAASRIHFAGEVPKAEVGEVMRQHDLMLMTSKSEGFSRSIVEGLASGLPVVTTSAGEPNGLVQTGVNGARVEGFAPRLFVPAVEIAAKLSANAASQSVAHLEVTSIVPDVLTIPRPRKQR